MYGRALALTVLLLSTAACYPSNVIEEADRSVIDEMATIEWESVGERFPIGFYESEELTGEAAGAILQIYYYFGEGGHYSGAALLLDEHGPTFQVLSGRWKYENGQLDLQDGSGPVQVRQAPGRLQLLSEGGTVIFKQVEMK